MDSCITLRQLCMGVQQRWTLASTPAGAALPVDRAHEFDERMQHNARPKSLVLAFYGLLFHSWERFRHRCAQ